MKMDLEKKEYDTIEEYKKYIYGSADVVGLMCLKVFVGGSEEKYNELSPFAISLGSAFQKVNFLRDLEFDYSSLGRMYFPNIDNNNLSNQQKYEIINDIEKDFNESLIGLKNLSIIFYVPSELQSLQIYLNLYVLCSHLWGLS